MRHALAALALLLAQAAAAAPVRTVSVVGSGQAHVRPNVAYVTLTFQGMAAGEKTMAQVTQEVNARVEPALARVKEIAGESGNVRVDSSRRDVKDYDRADNNKLKKIGTALTTVVQVTLRGQDKIQDALGKLYDNEAIAADEVSEATLGLSGRTQQAANRRALKAAMKDAENEAKAQLLPGETLGKALHRGNTAQAPVRHAVARSMAAGLESAAPMGGGAAPAVETGKITIAKATNVLFEVRAGRAKPKR